MILAAVTALLLQAAPIPVPKATSTASIGGVVVQSVTGEPLPNVQVTLARTDSNLGAFGAMVSTDTPPAEIRLPGALLEAIKSMPAPPGSDAVRESATFASLDTSDIDQIIVSPAGGISVVSKSVAPVTTDPQGRFRFDGVQPGTYRLILSADGYAKQERRAGGSELIVVAANVSQKDIVLRTAPTGAISGRIADNRSRPIAGAPVQLFRFSYDQIGQRRAEVIAATQTDDRGEYRFYFLSPGRYHLKAGNEDSLVRTPSNSGPGDPFQQQYLSPNRVAQNYALTYYPGTPDLGSANSIELLPGADLGGIDLFLGPQQTYRVRGRVIDASTGQPPASANVALTPQITNSGVFSVGISSTGPRYNPTDGTFQIENVAPGTYTLSAEARNPNQRPVFDISSMSTAERTAYFEAMNAEQRKMPKGSAAIDVANADVDGVAIVLGATARLSGRIRIAPEAADSKISLESLRVQLRLLTGNQTNALLSGPVKTDGTFTIEEVGAEPYKLNVIGLPPGTYVKTARMGNTDILNTPLRISGSNSGDLDILIGRSAGKIQGKVLDTGGQPAQAVPVVLIPDENRVRTELFRPVTTDAQGQFVLDGIAPGNYKIAAWQTLEPFGFFDPDLLRQVDQNGKSVRITESSEVTVTIPAWP